MANRRSHRDVDISTHRTEPRLGWRGNLLVWGTVLLLFTIAYSLDRSLDWSMCWTFPALVAALVTVCAGVFALRIILKRGVFTWMRLAQQPAKLMARGDAAAAEAACTRALARARRYAEHDHRRALMLCELAMFVKNQGRMAEALALYEESVAILAQHQDKEPFDYFVGLNNFGICFIHLKDYERAQRILEKAIDLTLAARKREGDSLILMPLPQVQLLQFVLHLNLAFLLMEMHELTEAEQQLREADALAPLLPKRSVAWHHDHYIAMCALWEFESGKFAAAETELADADNPDYPPCLRVRAKLHMVRQEFAEAETLFRKYHDEERKKGTLHLPDKLKPTLEFAECLFGQGKHAEALAALQEARAIAADFGIPGDVAWRNTLTIWLQRARELERADLVESLDKEIAQIPATPTSRAVTIVNKFRSHG